MTNPVNVRGQRTSFGSPGPPARQILDLLNLDLSHVRQEPGTSPEHHDTRMQPGASDPARTC
jgi:hypothetical protein